MVQFSTWSKNCVNFHLVLWDVSHSVVLVIVILAVPLACRAFILLVRKIGKTNGKTIGIGIDWEKDVAGFVSFAYWAFSIPINGLPRE